MTKPGVIYECIIEFGRKRLWLVNGILVVFVTIVLLMTTEAPVVLYQAF